MGDCSPRDRHRHERHHEFREALFRKNIPDRLEHRLLDGLFESTVDNCASFAHVDSDARPAEAETELETASSRATLPSPHLLVELQRCSHSLHKWQWDGDAESATDIDGEELDGRGRRNPGLETEETILVPTSVDHNRIIVMSLVHW